MKSVHPLRGLPGAPRHPVTIYDLIADNPETAEYPTGISTDDLHTWCLAMAGESPTLRHLLADAEARGWQLGFAELAAGGFAIDGQDRQLVINISTPAFRDDDGQWEATRQATLLTALARGLRDLWHDQPGFTADDCHPEDLLMLERVRAADCDTVAILVLWELRRAGHHNLWRHVAGSADGDLALVFASAFDRDPDALRNDTALAACFCQWYANDARVDLTDHETLDYLDDSFDRIDLGRRRVGAGVVECLSMLPDGRCYLAGLGETIRQDPYFAGLKNSINQSHLFHLVYDSQVVMVNNVPFRDIRLARRIFPDCFDVID